MNILLTGGLGYVGSHTAITLSQQGHKVVLYDNQSNSSLVVLKKLAEITKHSMPFINGDVRNTELLKHALVANNIDGVIHFAGLKAVADSVIMPVDYYANNVQGTISLLQAMQSSQIKVLIFSSSATVYGQPTYLPLDENHPTTPTNPYGRSKLYIERILNDIAESDVDWRIACLRYFNPVGAHENGLIGDNPNGSPNNLLPYISQVASGMRTELKVFGADYSTPDGTGVRDYIHIMDLAMGHVAALNFIAKTNGWHSINLGTGKGCSVFEMINAFEKESCRKVPYRIVARRPGDVAVCFADPKKALALLNWTAKRTLKEICSSAWKFQQSV